MELPASFNPLICYFDPGGPYITLDGNNNILAMPNLLNGQICTVQQYSYITPPVWNSTAMNGTPGIVCSGSQGLNYLLPCSTNNASLIFYVACQNSNLNAGQPICIASSISSNNDFCITFEHLNSSLFFVYSDLYDDNGHGHTITGPRGSVDLNPHVFTVIYNRATSTLSLRKDGAPYLSGSVSAATGNTTFPNFTIGTDSYNWGNGAAAASYYGAIGPSILSLGTVADENIENYLMRRVKIIQ